LLEAEELEEGDDDEDDDDEAEEEDDDEAEEEGEEETEAWSDSSFELAASLSTSSVELISREFFEGDFDFLPLPRMTMAFDNYY
jgi:hypothetical protein